MKASEKKYYCLVRLFVVSIWVEEHFKLKFRWGIRLAKSGLKPLDCNSSPPPLILFLILNFLFIIPFLRFSHRRVELFGGFFAGILNTLF